MELTPTLWRTCRVLAGPTRLELLRRILAAPDLSVSELTAAVGITETRASQELRRLQARGLVQAVRAGRYVRYRPVPDPLVPSAKPLLAAMKAALARDLPEADAQTMRVAKACGHPRRIAIARELLAGPCRASGLRATLGLPWMALGRHLRALQAGGVARHTRAGWIWAANPHPLAKCLAGLVGPGRSV